jgi:hypothetical protein
VEEAVTALGYSTELAHHLFRECWAIGTGNSADLCRVFGWEVEAHRFKVATAAGLLAELSLTLGIKRYPVPGMPDPSRPLKHKVRIKPAR